MINIILGKRMEKVFQVNGTKKRVVIFILIPDKIDRKQSFVKRDKKSYFILSLDQFIKRKLQCV